VNTPEFYERREDRALPDQPAAQPRPEEGAAPLAVHRDPSLPATTPTDQAKLQRPGVAWVRPSDLATLLGSPAARRGIDLQNELVRRSRRSPITAARAGRRITRTAIARPEPAASTTPGEELGL
jgi:hypothetical protein